jgi:hypothetical protein
VPWTNDPTDVERYVAACCDLIRDVTGRPTVPFGPPVRRGGAPTGSELVAPRAHFVHLDNSRMSAGGRVAATVEPQGLRAENAVIYNVWRSLTPPPQDIPLAVTDWRTIVPSDFVDGTTVERGGFAAPHLRLAASGTVPRWYYVPDLRIDEVLIFVGTDLDPSHPLGCAHSAFESPLVEDSETPRESVEMRVIACQA